MTRAELVEKRFDWAKQHVESLDRELIAYMSPPDPYALRVHINDEFTQYTYHLVVGKQIPDHWPFLVGDLIHNLRSTLDNIAFNLAGSPRADWGDKIEFPVVAPGPRRRYRPGQKSVGRGGRTEFNRVAPTKLKGVHEDAIAIIESMQPYHGLRGEWRRNRFAHPLSVINHMSNVDKHRAPHVGFGLATAVALSSTVEPIDIQAFSGRLLEDDAVVAVGTFPRPVQPDVDVHNPTASAVVALEVPWARHGKRLLALGHVIDCFRWMDTEVWQPLRPFLK